MHFGLPNAKIHTFQMMFSIPAPTYLTQVLRSLIYIFPHKSYTSHTKSLHASLCCIQVLVSILTNGEKQRGMATLVEGDLGHIEEALIQV